MDANVAGCRPTLALDGLWDFEFEGPTARLDGEGHTIPLPGSGRPSFPRWAMRRGLDAIGAASRSRQGGR